MRAVLVASVCSLPPNVVLVWASGTSIIINADVINVMDHSFFLNSTLFSQHTHLHTHTFHRERERESTHLIYIFNKYLYILMTIVNPNVNCYIF